MDCCQCKECGDEFAATSIVTLHPCSCKLCVACFLHVSSQAPPPWSCKKCQVDTLKVSVTQRSRKRGRWSPEVERVVDVKASPANRRLKTHMLARRVDNGDIKIPEKGVLVTEQSWLVKEEGVLELKPKGFSFVDAGGNLEEEDGKNIAGHFCNFHSVLLPSAAKRSKLQEVVGPQKLTNYYMSDANSDALYTCILALATGFGDFTKITNKFLNKHKKKPEVAKEAVEKIALATGLIGDILVRAMSNQNIAGPAIRCLSNIFRYEDDEAKKNFTPDNDNVYSMASVGKRMPTKILRTDELGFSSIFTYTKKFSLNEELVGERHDTGLSKPKYFTQGDLGLVADKRALLATSVNKSELKKGSVSELTKEIQKLGEHISIPNVTRLKDKPAVVSALIETRTRAFRANSDLRASLEQAAIRFRL